MTRCHECGASAIPMSTKTKCRRCYMRRYHRSHPKPHVRKAGSAPRKPVSAPGWDAHLASLAARVEAGLPVFGGDA